VSDGYVGPSNRTVYEMYLAELRAAGKDPARARVMGGDLWLIVAEDPDRTYATHAPICSTGLTLIRNGSRGPTQVRGRVSTMPKSLCVLKTQKAPRRLEFWDSPP